MIAQTPSLNMRKNEFVIKIALKIKIVVSVKIKNFDKKYIIKGNYSACQNQLIDIDFDETDMFDY